MTSEAGLSIKLSIEPYNPDHVLTDDELAEAIADAETVIEEVSGATVEALGTSCTICVKVIDREPY